MGKKDAKNPIKYLPSFGIYPFWVGVTVQVLPKPQHSATRNKLSILNRSHCTYNGYGAGFLDVVDIAVLLMVSCSFFVAVLCGGGSGFLWVGGIAAAAAAAAAAATTVRVPLAVSTATTTLVAACPSTTVAVVAMAGTDSGVATTSSMDRSSLSSSLFFGVFLVMGILLVSSLTIFPLWTWSSDEFQGI